MNPIRVVAVTALIVVSNRGAFGQAPPNIESYQKISQTSGGFTGVLEDDDGFGAYVSSIGDLDGNGVMDLVVGLPSDDEVAFNQGAVWILFLASDGTVLDHQKINGTQGGFSGDLDEADIFGSCVEGIGDLDGDGVSDIAVGAVGDDDGGGFPWSELGAVWILFLNSDGTVKNHNKISDTQGLFLEPLDSFGGALAPLGDLTGDGTLELAVGAYGDDDGGSDRGAVWVLSLLPDGSVSSFVKISDTQGGSIGPFPNECLFGVAATAVPDLDGDGIVELAVGSFYTDGQGAVWICFLNAEGTVRTSVRIDETSGGFTGTLDAWDEFASVEGIGDFNRDGLADLAVGANKDDDGGMDRGAVWILALASDGSVKANFKISATSGGFGGALDDFDSFGGSVSALGDLDQNGYLDVVVSAAGDDDGGLDRGALWVLFRGKDKATFETSAPPEDERSIQGLFSNPDQRRVVLRAACPLDPAAVPVLVLLPGGREVTRWPHSTAGMGLLTRLYGRPAPDGRAVFELPWPQGIDWSSVRCEGFFVQRVGIRLVPAMLETRPPER